MTDEQGIKEGARGGYKFPAEKIIPKDAKFLFSTDSFDFFYSKENKKLYLKTTNYHTGELEISLNKLEELVNFLRNE